MKKFFLAFFLLTSLACTVSTVEPSVNTAAQIVKTAPEATQTASPQSDAIALGRVRVRSACGIGLEQGCTQADLGWYEAGAKVLLSGDVVYTAHPDCQQWQPVNWRGAVGYVCAAWLAK